MSRWFVWSCLLLGAAQAAAAEIDFAHQIAPLLKQHCGKCHAGTQQEGGLSINTRESLLAGGETGPVIQAGDSAASGLIERVSTEDESLRMPPEGPRLTAQEIVLLKQWIDAGLPWEPGFAFGERAYEPPLRPRRPELPPPVDGRDHPLDRIIDAYLAEHSLPAVPPVDDRVFARRVWLDLVGLLPTPAELDAFLADSRPDKRTRLVQELLARDVDYAEHWLTFWNDLLRNDYTGTGFITGGRSQISKWLYAALVSNMPYDQFARELIAPPTPDSAGFIQGIRWRGEVSAGQTVEVQFAQSIGQSFLGINLKCASCHDSFIDRWKLDESYGLAAIYATTPLEIHRCDKPLGKMASPAWLFPELGQIDANAPQPQRLEQLAALMTHAENGRFTRTIVNRLWHRLMGHGIVHPTDAMQTEPWNADLLDYLAVHLADNGYDLKKTLELIATSAAYQGQVEAVGGTSEEAGFQYQGPRARRLTAEQFMDAVWQITGSAPTQYDAPVLRGKVATTANATELAGRWIWSQEDAASAAAGAAHAFKKTWTEREQPQRAFAVLTCDNSYVLYVNGKRVLASDNWEMPGSASLVDYLKQGENEVLIVARNGGSDPNPAGLYFEARVQQPDSSWSVVASDSSWQFTASVPDDQGQFAEPPGDWKPAVEIAQPEIWSKVKPALTSLLAAAQDGQLRMVRAGLVKSDFLMRSLGRPNRDQIVTSRPTELSTLEAIDLSNGDTLAASLAAGAQRIESRSWPSPAALAEWLFTFALSRPPSSEEMAAMTSILGPQPTRQNIEDALWAVIMLPEFQIVR